jgi:hypothetical protein
MRSIVASVGLTLTLVASAARVDAAPITYEFSGTGSGAIGGTPFTDAAVIYTGTADTGDVVTISLMGFTFYAVGLDDLTVNIEGIGTATITDLSKIMGIPEAIIDPDGDLPPLAGLMLMRIDDPSGVTNMETGTGMAALFSNSLTGYNLTTSIGPFSGVGGVGFIEDCGTPGEESCIQTSLGALSFTTNIESTGTFQATVEAVSVPEPATLLLAGSGLAIVVRRSRRGGRG